MSFSDFILDLGSVGWGWPWQRLVFGGLVVLIVVTVFAWRVMTPFWLVAGGVALYLRYSRSAEC